MALDSDRVRVGANADIYVANVGTTAPTDIASSWAAGWNNLGYVSEDGITVRWGKTKEGLNALQSIFPVRFLVTGAETSLSFSLLQFEPQSILTAFDGGTITEPSGGVFKWTPPDTEQIVNKSLGVEWRDTKQDNTEVTYRLVIPRATVTEALEFNLARNAAIQLPVTMSVMAPAAGEDPLFILSDDPDMDPTP